MNSAKIINELNKKYPNKNVVVNNRDNPTEILCQIDPADDHLEYSVIVAVIDRKVEHTHQDSKEKYEVLKGELVVQKNGKRVVLKKGHSIIIEPGEKHSAEGHEVWVKITSKPGWNPEEHLLVE